MSSINYLSGTTAIANYKGEELSTSTKIRLEALGIEPNSIRTESQAQAVIAQAEAASKNGLDRQYGGNLTREELLSQAKQLASKVGVQVSNQDSLENILDKISEKLNNWANEPEKADIVREYQAELANIAKRADITINIHKNIYNIMEMISVSNKLILGL